RWLRHEDAKTIHELLSTFHRLLFTIHFSSLISHLSSLISHLFPLSSFLSPLWGDVRRTEGLLLLLPFLNPRLSGASPRGTSAKSL
ncbi:MAG: hypothetical protein WC987_06210, partial [Mariniphaga sp.]